jgi:hypothetical protein
VAFRGPARIPRRIARQLTRAARACAAAAAALEASARDAGTPSDAMSAAADAESASHSAAVSSAQMLGGGFDREDVVAIARALQILGGRLEEAAFGLRQVERREALWAALTGVVRDAAREVAAAIDSLDGPAAERDARLDRTDELHREWRQLIRSARAQALTQDAEPKTALAADMALRRLETAEAACRDASRTVRAVAIKHA